jgi:nickel-dependent lactate racemase
MASECREGHGSETFFESYRRDDRSALLEKEILSRDFEHTVPDQWQTQILCRLLRKFTIVFITKHRRRSIERFGMIHASSFEEALATADRILGRPDAPVTVIPDGVSVIVSQRYVRKYEKSALPTGAPLFRQFG